MRKFFLNAKVLIGHNLSRYDIPVVERLLNIKVTAKIVDSLALSWAMFPDKLKHGLAEWGEEFGRPKPEIGDWENLSYEEYEHRCSEDVEINRLLWEAIWNILTALYSSHDKIWEYLDYLSFKMYCARLQEESGWHVDEVRLRSSLQRLIKLRSEKIDELTAVMPKVPKYRTKERPKVFFKKDGSYSSHALEWNKLLAERGLPGDHTDPIQIHIGDDDPNPGSVDQIKNWLFSLGWVPQTYKTVKNKKTGETKQVPQVSLEQTKELCPSVINLIERQPKISVLEGLTTVSSRIATLNGILSSLEEGKSKAQVAGLTNTLRFKHKTLVNLPKPDKLYAEDVRGSLIAPEGFILCGSDMKSLEDKIKQNYIYPFDPKYVERMNKPDYDPHLTIAVMGSLLTEEQVEAYKSGDRTNKSIRDVAKTTNYALQYQCGIPRLMQSANIDRLTATKLFNAYWELNWAVKKVASIQSVKVVEDQMWLKNPINGFYYSLRKEKDIFSTLVQGTASYVFDMWIKNILDIRPQLTATFHDEGVWTIRKGFEKQCSELITKAINDLNNVLKLNVELAVDIQFGDRYSDVH